MKVIICSNFYPPNFVGGAELVAHQHAKSLQSLGHEVIIFAGNGESSYERHTISKDLYDGVLVYRVALEPKDFDQNEINFINPVVENSFNALLQDFSPEVVCFHNLVGLSTKIILCAKRHGVSTVAVLHDYWGFCYKNTTRNPEGNICNNPGMCMDCMQFVYADGLNVPLHLRKNYINLMFEYLDLCISPSRYLADRYVSAGIHPNKFKVLWNGIDISRFSHAVKNADERIRFTYIGYFGKHKGVGTLLEALNMLKNNHNVFVNLVGFGEEESSYKNYIKNNKLDNYVKFFGKVDNKDIAGVLQETDVLVLPSVWPENQPVTITEAMASKIPAIVSNCGGSVELVLDGESGYIFEVGKASDLAAKMLCYLNNRDTIRTHGERAYGIMKRHDSGVQVRTLARWFGLLRKLSRSMEQINVCQKVIIFYADKFNMDDVHTINNLVNKHSPVYRYVFYNWLQNDIATPFAFCCHVVLSGSILIDDIFPAFERGEPILVCDENTELSLLYRLAGVQNLVFDKQSLYDKLMAVIDNNEEYMDDMRKLYLYLRASDN